MSPTPAGEELARARQTWDEIDIGAVRAVGWNAIAATQRGIWKRFSGGGSVYDLVARELRRRLDAHGRADARGVALVCGDMAGERGFFETDLVPFERVDGFDLSAASLARYVPKPGLRFVPHVLDCNELELEPGSVDLVVGWHGLHHVRELENLFDQARRALRPGGLLVMYEWIGPRQLQIPARNARLAGWLLTTLFPSKRARTTHAGKRKGAHWIQYPPEAFDPSEACRSDALLPTFLKHFTPLRLDLHGGLLYPMFEGLAAHLSDGGPTVRARVLAAAAAERVLTRAGIVEPLFAAALAEPRPLVERVRAAHRRPLRDLGEAAPALAGILSPGIDPATVSRYVHEQFTRDAEAYAARYEDRGHFTWLLQGALSRAFPQGTGGPLLVLDVGSGSGNTIFPLLELCPRASVVASDLSLELLALLRQGLQRGGHLERCALAQLNAEELAFEEGTFDLVVGGAILHHLFSPELTIQACARILGPGGRAVFFEPFAEGSLLLRDAYAEILAAAQQPALSEEVADLLRRLVLDFDVRSEPDKRLPVFQRIDDKWLFTREWLQRRAEEAGFRRCAVTSVLAPDRPFETQTGTYLRLGAGKGPEALPDWAWDVVRRLDRTLSAERKAELPIEGTVVLER